jgi:uncharacterized membrane protein (UPF0127 family)
MMRYLVSALTGLFALSACSGIANGSSAAKDGADKCVAGKLLGTSEAGLEQTSLCVISGKKVHAFTVEIARTSMQQAKGLMFRSELADDKGMVFPFPETRGASFWMKNTFIPLDIIFVRADGSIENIAANTTPYSTDPVLSTAPVAAVLELRGGLAAELGIKPGDKVRWIAN